MGVDPDVSVFGDGAVIPAFGINGGSDGSLNEGFLNRGRRNEKRLSSNEGWNKAKSGDSVTVLSAGGGGWGDPLERPAEAVLEDVHDEMITLDWARDRYGVVIKNGKIDQGATTKQRAELRAKRGTAA